MTTTPISNSIRMDNKEESPSKAEISNATDGRSRSITDRFPIAPLVAAGRLMSFLSKQSYNVTAKRKFTLSAENNEKSKQAASVRNRSLSPPKISFSTMRNSTTTPSNLDRFSNTIRTSEAPTTPTPDTVGLDFNFDSVYAELRELADTNCKYFSEQKTDVCKRFERLLIQLLHSIDLSVPLIRYLTDNFHHFDYSPEVRASGYRSLVVAHGQACLRTLDILRQVDTKRVGLLFNLMYSSRLFQDLESWTKALLAMQRIIALSVKMVDYSEKKVDADHVPLDIELDYFKMVAFDSEYFFGRTCGFQFAPSMQKMLTLLLAGLATFYETYNRSISYAAASLATAPKYILFPEQRAKKCAAIFRDSDYLFCKSFWNIVDHDYVKMGSRYIVPNVTVSKYFQIGPEPIEIGSIIIPPPTASSGDDEPNERAAGNIGAGSDNPTGSGSEQPRQLVNIKLLSNEIREGMSELPLKKADLEIASTKILPMSDQLLIHIHGGGFIATSSTTHEIYLKPWALGLEVPIVSIDYSLAPEYPYPRAIEECFYAYAWILKNANKLGWTGKTLLLAGDSAGGNLVTIVTIKAIEAGLRKPDSIICFYTPFLLGYSMSPSRLMAIMDPLLNTGFLWRCLAAYAGIKADDEPPHDELESASINDQNDSSIGKRRKIAHSISSSGPIPSKSDSLSNNEIRPEYIRGDTYYTQLGDIMGSRQALLLRKLRESTLPNTPHMSPLRASDEILRQFPTTYLVACHQDPLLDDSITFARHLRSLDVEHHMVIPCARDPFIDDNIEFARRLRDLKVPHHLTVVDEWPHGFLDFGFAATDVAQYNIEIRNMLLKILQQSSINADNVASVPSHID
ncbi:unnamed protein product [Adineta steineri]|uniref:Hormone-sensitive lipase n=1 Tax=Adineta steineri TaxID=433720 RepID=A0A813N6Q8_9BILA|nr:unnamed protein product [Adineta steineri]